MTTAVARRDEQSGNGRISRPNYGSDILERRLPYDLDAEQGLLGSVLLLPDCLDDVCPILAPCDFFDEANRRLYEELQAMHNEGRGIDVTTLIDRLKRASAFEVIGGGAYLHKIGGCVPNPAHARYYAQIVADHARRRELITASTEMMRSAYEDCCEMEELVANAEERIMAIRDRRSTDEPDTMSEVTHRCLDELDRRLRGEACDGIMPTGFTDLDGTLAGGLRPGQLIILAARTGVGKSVFASDIARHIAGELGRLVLFVSLEMSTEELGFRMMSAQSGVNNHRIRTATISQADRIRLVETAASMAQWPLHIEDDAGLKPLAIAAMARRLTRRQRTGLGLLVIDYIQIVDNEKSDSRDSREREVAKNARFFKRLSKEFNCPVLCLAQVNRKPEDRNDHVPRLSDLRESGALEQDADVVLFIHREEYFRQGESAREVEGQAEIYIAKQRNGPTGKVELRWDKAAMRFQNLAPLRLQEFEDYTERSGLF